MANNLNKLSNTDLAYIAGFLDGDGSIYTKIIRREDYKSKFQLSVEISLTQSRKRLYFLQQLQKDLGMGALVKARSGEPNISDLVIKGENVVGPLLRAIMPYLRLKSTQAKLMLNIIERLPISKKDPSQFVEICKIADKIANLNDSKKRTVTSQTVENIFKDLGIL